MTIDFRSAAAVAPLPLSAAPGSTDESAVALAGPRVSFCLISNAASASMRDACAPPWSAPSAPPMPPAPGTGRRPTTPARRRPSCSCASSARPCAREPRRRPRAADAGQDRRPSAHAYAPLRGEPGASAVLDADRARLRRRTAAAITPADVVLEPSAGTGLLAIFAELVGRIARPRTNLPRPAPGFSHHLFPGIAVTRFDAAHIDDHLDAGIVPSVVLMNPPFSVVANVDGRIADAALRHVASALARLAEGGRLVAITGASCRPRQSGLARRLRPLAGTRPRRLHRRHRRRGLCQARHHLETRLTVIDRLPADDPTAFPASPGMAPDVATLLGWVMQHVPARLAGRDASRRFATPRVRPFRDRAAPAPCATSAHRGSGDRSPQAIELAYETVDWTAGRGRPHHRGALRSLRLAVDPHSRRAAASDQARAVGGDGLGRAAQADLSAAPAGQRRHRRPAVRCPAREPSSMPARPMPAISPDRGRSTRPSTSSRAAPDDAENAVRFRRGWLLGDGTGAGKGRQVAGILLDNWLQGPPPRGLDLASPTS